jgi:hypothetical protein
MIRTDAGLAATRESLRNLEEAFLDLTHKRDQYHPATFALLAVPIRAEIQARRAEIDAFIGLTEPTASPPGDGEVSVARNGHGGAVLTRP